MGVPLTWADLQRHQPSTLYIRKPAVETAYQKAIARGNLEDRIRIEHMGWVFDNALGRAVRPPRGWRRTALVPNKYPYWTVKGIQHWLLWSDRPLSAASVQAILGNRDIVWFVNQPELRSVPGLWHAHVFYRNISSKVDQV